MLPSVGSCSHRPGETLVINPNASGKLPVPQHTEIFGEMV
jgi:hypothetical protein